MNFLRQQTAEAFDALLKRHSSSDEEEEGTKSPEPPLPEDPEMDAAIEEMKDRLSNLRAKGTLQRMRNSREMDQLQTKHRSALQRARDTVATVSQKLHMTPYLAATKLVHQEMGEDMLPGVVVTLQAKLCLHIHAMCNHQEQLMLLKRDSNEVIYWYEDMVKQLRRDQADHELQLMNELVQAKIHIGELVDAKKMRERRESANKRMLSRRFSHGVARTKSANSNVVPSLKQARLRGRMSNPQNFPLRMSLPGTTGTSFRQRTVRQISTRGLGLQKVTSMRHLQGQKMTSTRHLQKAQSIRNMKNYTVNNNDNDGSQNSLTETTLSPGVSPVSVRRVHQLPTAAASNDDNNKANGSGGLPPPSDDISARRAARAQARSAGRPIRRGVQRTRSRSLTDMQRGARRGSRRSGLSKDDENVSRRRISDSASKPLLVGFPSRRAQDDSNCMMKRKGSTRDLLRGFSPAPPVRRAPPQASDEDQEGSFTSTLKSWVGNVSVLLQPAVGISTQEHKLTLVG